MITEYKMNGLNNQRTYGVEIEFISNEWGQRDLLDRINTQANSLELDMPKVYLASYSDTDSSKWRLKTDSSVSGGRGYGLELVSPILKGENDMIILKTFMELLNSNHCDVNRTCGLHVHVGVRDWGVDQFKNLAKRYSKFEKAIDTVMPISRRESNGNYCRSHSNVTGTNLAEVFKTISKCRTSREVAGFFQSGRYYKLNLDSFWKHGTVEFRHHSGTICPAKIENWTRVCIAMTVLADEKRSVKVVAGETPSHFKNKLSSFMNGLVKTGQIDSTVRRFYTKRARALCTS